MPGLLQMMTQAKKPGKSINWSFNNDLSCISSTPYLIHIPLGIYKLPVTVHSRAQKSWIALKKKKTTKPKYPSWGVQWVLHVQETCPFTIYVFPFAMGLKAAAFSGRQRKHHRGSLRCERMAVGMFYSLNNHIKNPDLGFFLRLSVWSHWVFSSGSVFEEEGE